MDLSTTTYDYACNLCSLHHVYLLPDLAKPTADIAKHKLFHEACLDCDKFAAESPKSLCDLCRHVRIRHLLVCIPERHPEFFCLEDPRPGSLAFTLYPKREESAQCHLCQFSISIVKQWIDAETPEEQKYREDHRYIVSERGSAHVIFGGNTRIAAELLGQRRRRVRDFIDWEWVREWLEESSKENSSMSEAFLLQRALIDVRVVDVDQACIVSLPSDCEYVALSYVWGKISGNRLQCTTSNLDSLQQPGALKSADLPQTITDAIRACQQLHQQFLWVDSLCIVQDGPPASVSQQLNQMANIYHRATWTLVAATGDSASYGLAGVSYARRPRQFPLELYNGFELVGSVPSLDKYLSKTTWAMRGWTYQEHVASRKLLFFTDYGLYLKGYSGVRNEFGRAEGEGTRYSPEELGLKIIEEFSKKSLTLPSDVLRATAGILETLYEDGLYHGMPLAEFDSVIRWMPTQSSHARRVSMKGATFPTWSWSSSSSPVVFPCRQQVPYSVAYWSRSVTEEITKYGTFPWPVIVPGQARDQLIQDPFEISLTCAALAWVNGCIRSEIPQELHIDVGAEEYNRRLSVRWHDMSDPNVYWKDAFQSYDAKKLFEDIDEEVLSNPTCLMVHTQTTSFSLDWRGQFQSASNRNTSCKPVIIRDINGRIAGSIELNDFAAHRLQTSTPTPTRFIALSVDRFCRKRDIREPVFLMPYIETYFAHLGLSEIYGCPCTSQSQTAREPKHFLECPKHVKFFVGETPRAGHRNYYGFEALKGTKQELSFTHYLPQVSYYDVNGKALHIERFPPVLWVMMIAPSEDRGEERKVYQRLGIGKIFLKPWVESSPSFESLVLE
jgi:hypothetical protein